MKAWHGHVVLSKPHRFGMELKSTHFTQLADTREQAAKQQLSSRFVQSYYDQGFKLWDIEVSLIDPAIAPINNQEFEVLGEK